MKTTGANNGSLTVGGLFTVTSQDNTTKNFQIGRILNKVGRTTGWSQGPVSRTCVNTGVQGSQIMQLCQTFVDAARWTVEIVALRCSASRAETTFS